jgi:hypothetical protein
MLKIVFYLVGQVHDVLSSFEKLVNFFNHRFAELVAAQVQQEEPQLLARSEDIIRDRLIAGTELCERDGVHRRRRNIIWERRDRLEELCGSHFRRLLTQFRIMRVERVGGNLR